MPNIELSERVKEKLDIYKNDSGSKTYSDAINFCLLQIELLKQNQTFLVENQKFLKENQAFLIKNQKLLLDGPLIRHRLICHRNSCFPLSQNRNFLLFQKPV